MFAAGRAGFVFRRALACIGFAAALGPLSGQGAAELVGIWVGSLRVRSQTLTIVFHIEGRPGSFEATIDSPDQGAKDLPVSTVTLDGALLRLESSMLHATYQGTLSADGTSLSGTWTQGGARLPLDMAKKDAAPVISRPQEPKPPYPYKTEDVVVENKRAGVRLAGTLVIPLPHANGSAVRATGGEASGEGPFPAVVFATGSGPQNRDEELLGHKPFLVIADYLARRGIASLRCDDRGTGQSSGDFSKATTFDLADDVEAEFAYLASRPEARKGSVGIVGHSEGGLIAPIIASRDAKVSFIVLLAGPGLSGERILTLQGAAIARAAGKSDREIEDAAAINTRLYAIAEGPGDAASLRAKLRGAYLDWLAGNTTMKSEERAAAEAGADRAVDQLASPWFRTFLSLDPAPYLAKVGIPVLALDGSKDLQVPSKENLAGIRAALGSRAGGMSPKSALLELPGLNHLFQHASTGSPDEYGKIEETFAPEALKAIGDWILGL
jgi:pimeloyl-ACP methyl ester carboxylesterase